MLLSWENNSLEILYGVEVLKPFFYICTSTERLFWEPEVLPLWQWLWKTIEKFEDHFITWVLTHRPQMVFPFGGAYWMFTISVYSDYWSRWWFVSSSRLGHVARLVFLLLALPALLLWSHICDCRQNIQSKWLPKLVHTWHTSLFPCQCASGWDFLAGLRVIGGHQRNYSNSTGAWHNIGFSPSFTARPQTCVCFSER